MFCIKCGAENSDEAQFCSKCGAQMENGEVKKDDKGAAEAETAADDKATAEKATESAESAKAAADEPAPAPAPTGSPVSTSAPASAAAATPAPAASAAPKTYSKGCVGAAWDDIKNSPNWVSKTLLLGLINIVPILNWVVPGYCMRWARQLPMGRVEHMPKDIFANRNFMNGVYWFVIALVFGIVSMVASSILGIVPILGALAAVVAAFFLEMFANLSVMRAALADQLGAAFDIKVVWDALKKDPWTLLVISVVPGLIVGAIVVVIAIIVCLISLLFLGGDVLELIYMMDSYGSYGYSYDYSTIGMVSAILTIFGAILPAILLVYLVNCFAKAFQVVLVFRALGHWTARYAGEWISEPTIAATAHVHQP